MTLDSCEGLWRARIMVPAGRLFILHVLNTAIYLMFLEVQVGPGRLLGALPPSGLVGALELFRRHFVFRS